MNRKLIKKIIDVLEGRVVPVESLGFNMEIFANDKRAKDVDNGKCGATACIAGWAVALGSPRVKFVRDLIVIEDFGEDGITGEAERLLTEGADLYDYLDTHELFNAYRANKPLEKITRADAAKVLRHLLKTGEVDWSII